MGTDREGRTQGQRPRPPASRAGDLRRIPLPPLPAFRRDGAPAPEPVPPDARGVSAAEQDGILSDEPAVSEMVPGPGHEGRADPLGESAGPRTGALGATILNDLVDEIERDLERDLGRLVPPDALPAYRITAGCSCSAPDAGGGPPAPAAGPGPEDDDQGR